MSLLSSSPLLAKSALPLQAAFPTLAPRRSAPGSSSYKGPARRVLIVPAAEKGTSSNVDPEKLLSDVKERWENVEDKPVFITYAVGLVAAVWIAGSVVNAFNGIPLLPKVFELVGLAYTSWFVYRYLLFKSSRAELIDDIEELKKKITGDN